MFDYKYEYSEVYRGYREAYAYYFGRDPDDKTLYNLAEENAIDATRGYIPDIGDIYDHVADHFEKVFHGNCG